MIPLRDNVPARRFPIVTIALIAANVAVFFYQYLLMPETAQRTIFLYGLIPRELTSGVQTVPRPFPPEVTLVTSMFVHGGFFHVAGNMLYLWIFGDNVEDAMGHARFIFFYLLSGLAAAFSQVISGPNSAIPMVGASGAVSGILGRTFSCTRTPASSPSSPSAGSGASSRSPRCSCSDSGSWCRS